MAGELKIELDEQQIEFLRKVHNARALQELRQHPGWEIYTDFVANMIAAWENQHLNFATKSSRDAYWISGVRLDAARSFAKILTEQIAAQVDLLKQPLTTKNQNGSDPEGD